MARSDTALRVSTRELVCSSFPLIERVAPQAGTMFYGRLSAIAPEVLPQFRRDLSQENFRPAAERRFMQLAQFIHSTAQYAGLPDSAGHDATVGGLAQRHVGYSTRAPHYAPLGQAFMWTLDQCLGAALTPAMRQAWSDTYEALVVSMIAPLAGARE